MRPFAACGLAAATIGLALALRLALDPWLVERLPFTPFYLAIALTAWWGGLRPALLAVALGLLAADFFFVPPRGAFSVPATAGDALGLVLFASAGVLIAVFSHSLRRARDRTRREAHDLATILHATPFMLTRCSRDLRYLFVSRAYAEMLGRAPEEIVGRPIAEVMGEKGFEAIRPHVEQVLRGIPVAYEGEISFEGAGTRALDVRYTPVRDERGEVSGWIASILDLHERRRAESERERLLAELESRLRDVQSLVALNRGLARSPELDELLPNLCRLAREVVGADGVTFVLREGDTVHYVAEDAIAPLWAGQHFPIERCISGWSILAQQTAVVEDVALDPRIPFETYRTTFVKSLVMVPLRREGECVGAMGAYWSRPAVPKAREVALLEAVVGAASSAVTNAQLLAEARASRAEAERAADALRRVQRISDALLDDLTLDEVLREVLPRVRTALAVDAVVILTRALDADEGEGALRVRAVDGAPEAEIGFAPPEGAGFCGEVAKRRAPVVWDDVAPDRLVLPFLERMGVRALAGVPLLSGDRLLGVLQVASLAPRRFAEGEIDLLRLAGDRIALGIERTARRDAERRARTFLEAANRAKDEFLAMLGHELRNPLAGLRNALLAASRDPARSASALEIALRQSSQLTRLVDDLLDVARLTRGRISLRREPIDLVEVVKRAVESTRPLADARGVALHVAFGAAAVPLDGDPTRLEQVFANLLSNAAKYTDAGGRIDVALEARDENVQVRVRDTGIGIAPDMLPRIFDLFSQGERSLDRAPGGLGIGLTLARRLVRLHGGHIEAASEGPGRGAEFVVTLPAPRAAAEAPAAPAKEPAPPAPTAHVLVVEDHRDAAESLAMLLRIHGHDARIAFDGPAALEAARAERPDVMLVDIGLPGVDGYEVARLVRNDEALSRIALVALTGYGREEDRQCALGAGFDHHLVKPVDPDELFALLAQAATRGAPPD